MFPYWDLRLHLLDQLSASRERVTAMCGGDHGHQCRLTDRNRAHPVGDRDRDHVERIRDGLGDSLQDPLGTGMGFIGQGRDRSAAVVVTHVTGERDGGASREGGDCLRQARNRDRLRRHDGNANLGHLGIIGHDGPMREVLGELLELSANGGSAAMATVVKTWRSAPRPAGAAMLVTDSGEAVGSVSGGCVEGALYDLGQEVLADHTPRLHTFGVSDDDAFAVGLTCGGILDIFVEEVNAETWPELHGIAQSIENEEPVAVATIVRGDEHVGRHLVIRPNKPAEGSLGTARLDDTVSADALGMLTSGITGFLHYGPAGERLGEGLDVFVASYAPPPQMFVFGAIDFSASLVRVGKLLGFKVTVCDARPIFATKKRFPEADEVVVDWPHRWLAQQQVDARTVIAVLTHDPKFDVPAIKQALTTPAGYIGAMGSRRTHEDRLRRLKEAGVTDSELTRLRSPIGLDLGARTPEETAISIAAEIISDRWGGSGQHLDDTSGPIHSGVDR